MKKIIYIILILILLFGLVFLVVEKNNNETRDSLENSFETKNLLYKNLEDGLEFSYPNDWGEVVIKEGNKICPEEDAYSSMDTLRIYNLEYSFNEIKLPSSQSFVRTGIRTYLLDPQNLNSCGDDFHLKLARKEIVFETQPSIKLNSITLESGLTGVENREVISINTAARRQYTFFVSENSKLRMIQTYMSFIPYYNSPELQEMDEKFNGDINEYVEKGETSEIIRKHFEEFTKMTKSLSYSNI